MVCPLMLSAKPSAEPARSGRRSSQCSPRVNIKSMIVFTWNICTSDFSRSIMSGIRSIVAWLRVLVLGWGLKR